MLNGKPADCSYDEATRDLSCPVTTLDAGVSTTFEFSVTVESLAPSQTSVLNKAQLTSPGDPVEPNNEDEKEIPVGEVDLALVKTVNKIEAKVGDTLFYSLEVTNNGPMNSTGAVVTDPLPSGLQFVSADVACQFTAGEVRCEVGELANGASKTFQLSALVEEAALGTMVENVAKVKAPGDKKPENDESKSTTLVPEESPETGLPDPGPEEPEEKPTPEPTPVPTMGSAGLVLMSLLVAGMAGLRQRRRR